MRKLKRFIDRLPRIGLNELGFLGLITFRPAVHSSDWDGCTVRIFSLKGIREKYTTHGTEPAALAQEWKQTRKRGADWCRRNHDFVRACKHSDNPILRKDWRKLRLWD